MSKETTESKLLFYNCFIGISPLKWKSYLMGASTPSYDEFKIKDLIELSI